MPKKGKKSKKDGKGKKKKNEEKEESLTKMAIRNSNIWEARLNMMEHAREHFRGAANELSTENEDLRDQMRIIEKDTIDVVSFLKKQDLEKDNEIQKLNQELKNIKLLHLKDKDEIIADYNKKIRDYEERLSKKSDDLSILKNELNQVKEFRKRKVQMQKELEEIKEAMVWNEKEHKEQIAKTEQKFFEEKMRLQQEANKKIEELAERAHDEAVKNLDEATRNIYKENVKLTESLKLNIDENESLKKMNTLMYEDNRNLKSELELNKLIIQEKVDLATKQAKQIKDLQAKIDVLEKSLSQVVREFEKEREAIIQKCRIEIESSTVELRKLRKLSELKTIEMNKVKKLAKTILDQRSEIERFFLDSLDYVKQQIIANQNEYRKEASSLYNNRMLAAYKGNGDYPKIRTFTKKFEASSTNNVFKDLEEAEKCFARSTPIGMRPDMENGLEISDLTWEQKEQVIRELFARLNTKSKSKGSQQSIDSNSNFKHQLAGRHYDEDDLEYTDRNLVPKETENGARDNYTFITQSSAQVEKALEVQNNNNNSIPKLPHIISTT